MITSEKIQKDFWIAIPDHISYFSNGGLINLMKHAGYKKFHITTDYPIDFNLMNERTNYIRDKNVGKSVHIARIEIENLFNSISVDKTNKLYSVFAEMGLGRNIIAYFKMK